MRDLGVDFARTVLDIFVPFHTLDWTSRAGRRAQRFEKNTTTRATHFGYPQWTEVVALR